MRRLPSILLGLAIALSLSACPADPATSSEAGAGGAFRAGIVFDVGGLGDKSFNDSANRGLERAKAELGVEGTYYEPAQAADRESGLRRFAAGGVDLIVGVGFMFTDELIALAKEFPDLRFACVDMAMKLDDAGKPITLPKNLVGLKFKEEEGSFLVGALAALMSKTGKVGFVGGMNVPLIHKFEAGYRAGVQHAAPAAEVLVGYAGETPEAFKDAAKGKSLALGMYEQGADVIFHASGQTGRGVFEAAKEKGKFAIGVDSDQWDEAPGHVLTSMIKRVDLAVFDAIKAAKEGMFVSGYKTFGLGVGGVDYVYDVRNQALIPSEVRVYVEALREQLTAGKLPPVPSTR